MFASSPRSILPCLALAVGLSLPAVAEVYLVEGDLFANGPTEFDPPVKGGEFQIWVDEFDLLHTIRTGDPGVGDPLRIEPWYGYRVAKAVVTVAGTTFTEANIFAVDPPASGSNPPRADFWIEGVPIDQLDTEDFNCIFERGGFSELVSIGGQTSTGDPPDIPIAQILFNEAVWSTVNGSGFGSGFFGAGVQNVTVTVSPLETLIDDFRVGGTGFPFSDTQADGAPELVNETGLDVGRVFAGNRTTELQLTQGSVPGQDFDTGNLTASLDTSGEGSIRFDVAPGSRGFPSLQYNFASPVDLRTVAGHQHLIVECEGFSVIRAGFLTNNFQAFAYINAPVINGQAQIPLNLAAASTTFGSPDLSQIRQLFITLPIGDDLGAGSYRITRIATGTVTGSPVLRILSTNATETTLGIANLPVGSDFHLRDSSDLQIFSIFDPVQDVNWSTPQPIVVPNGGVDALFFNLFRGLSVP